VIDPMCGSGTTPAVAKRPGGNSIGIEILESYAEAA
jgi:DNA modification methylase